MQHIIDIDVIIKSATTLVCGLMDPKSSLHKGLVRGRMADRNLIREIWHYMAPQRIRCDGTPQTITTNGQHLYVLTCERESTIHKISLTTGRTVASIDHLGGARLFETCLLKHQHGLLYLVWNDRRDIAVLDLDLNFVRAIQAPISAGLAFYNSCGMAVQESTMYFISSVVKLQSFEINGDGNRGVKVYGELMSAVEADAKSIWVASDNELVVINPANGEADLVLLPVEDAKINTLVLDDDHVLVEFMTLGTFGCYRKSDASPVGDIKIVLNVDEENNWEERYTHEVCTAAGVVCINMPDHNCVYVLPRPFPPTAKQN